MAKISISIVTYNSADVIGVTLDALTDNWPTALSCHCYVVDNGSTDRTLEIVERHIACHPDRMSLLCSPKGNIGYGAGHNLVLPLIDSFVHVVMNPDIVLLDDHSLPALTAFLEVHPDIGLVVPRIEDPAGTIQHLCRREPTLLDLFLRFTAPALLPKRHIFHTMQDFDYDKNFEVPFASGCMMCLRTDLFRSLGGFDENIFLYMEDADLTRRVNQVSRTVYVPEAKVRHDWQRSSYRKFRMFSKHLRSLAYYFRKWGFRFA